LFPGILLVLPVVLVEWRAACLATAMNCCFWWGSPAGPGRAPTMRSSSSTRAGWVVTRSMPFAGRPHWGGELLCPRYGIQLQLFVHFPARRLAAMKVVGGIYTLIALSATIRPSRCGRLNRGTSNRWHGWRSWWLSSLRIPVPALVCRHSPLWWLLTLRQLLLPPTVPGACAPACGIAGTDYLGCRGRQIPLISMIHPSASDRYCPSSLCLHCGSPSFIRPSPSSTRFSRPHPWSERPLYETSLVVAQALVFAACCAHGAQVNLRSIIPVMMIRLSEPSLPVSDEGWNTHDPDIWSQA